MTRAVLANLAAGWDRIPLGRMITLAAVAKAACFLSSPSAGGISGTNLVVDGAMMHRVQY